MRKFTVYYLSCLFLIFGFLFLFPNFWFSWLLSIDFKIPVKLNALSLTSSTLNMKNFSLYNPKPFKKGTALKVKEIAFSLPSSYKPTVIIDRIEFSNVHLFVEYKTDKTSNWAKIIENSSNSKNDRKYLVRKFILKKIQVEVLGQEKSQKTYPIIDEVVIENISNASGFPFSKLEKALADAIAKKVFPLFGIKNLIEAPFKIIPKIFPFLDKSSAQELLEPNEKNTQTTCESPQPQK